MRLCRQLQRRRPLGTREAWGHRAEADHELAVGTARLRHHTKVVSVVNKGTAGQLLAITNDYGDYALDAGAHDQVSIYLSAVDLLAALQDDVVDLVRGAMEEGAQNHDTWQELRQGNAYLGDATVLARLLSSVQS